MNSLASCFKRRAPLALLGCIFIIAPLYTHPNIGGIGLNLPFNITEWVAATLFIFFSFYSCANKNKVLYNPLFVYTLIFPATLILSGIVEPPSQPIVWFFRQLFIIGGLFFVFALFQLKLTTRQLENFLYLLVLSTLIHALIGVSQLLNLSAFQHWIPPSQNQSPIGVFQQVNVQASYLTTGLLIILYLISRPSFFSTKLLTKILFAVTFCLGVYVVVSSGSRVGILSLVMGSSLMLFSRRKQLSKHKVMLSVLLIASIVGVTAGQTGLNRALDKTTKLTESEYASARKSMYTIGLELIKNKPILGYGIGSFPRVWTEQTAKFSKLHPNATLPQVTSSHPHNEFLFWIIEGGIASAIGLLAIVGAILRSLYLCGFTRGGAYAALLLPITLHTQVELPFYSSSVHWFLWLFLIFVTFRHQTKTIDLNISRAAKTSVQIASIIIGLGATSFLLHAEKAESALFDYMYKGNGNLQIALDNIYFNNFAEKLMMQTLLYSSIKENNKRSMPVFITWAEKSIKNDPETGMFILLTDAYGFIGDDKKQCLIARKGLAIYTQNERLKKTISSCIERNDQQASTVS